MIRKLCFIYLLLCVCLLPTLSAQAIELTLKDQTGKAHHIADYKGKWLLVNYWATWCPPCLEEIPDLVNLYDAHHDKDLMVIGVAVDYESTSEVAKYVDDMLMSYPIVLSNDKASGVKQQPEVLPTTYIYSPDGKLFKIKQGLITKQWIEKLLTDKSFNTTR
jgi:thiol-disulfide isomerase/thioredoxin